MNKILFACYTGSSPFLSASEIAEKVNLPVNDVLAELDELIRAKRVVQIANGNRYVFAIRAALP